MSDLVYSVEVRYLQNGSLDPGTSGLNKLASKTDDWGKKLFGTVEGFAGKFNSAFDSLAMSAVSAGASVAASLGAGIATGIVAATKVAFDFNEELEKTQISLAAIANANGTVDGIGNGMRLASDVIRDMRKDAAQLPGEFKDLANIMMTIESPLSQLGLGMHASENVSKKVMSAAAVLMGSSHSGMTVAAREMAMMLEGNARHNMPFFNRLNLGMGTSEFNKLAPEKRLRLIQEALDKLSPAMKVFENSWNAIKTTTIDKIRGAIASTGGPLFENIKGRLKAFNDKFDPTSKLYDPAALEKASKFGEKLGIGIEKAFNHGVEAIQHWYPLVMTFAENIGNELHNAWNRFGPAAERLIDRVEAFMQDPAAFDKISGMVKELVVLRAASGALSLGASVGPSLFKTFGGSVGAEAMEALATTGPLAAAGLAVFAVAAYGIADVVMNASNVWHDTAMNNIAVIEYAVGRTMGELEKLGSALKPVADFLGMTVLAYLEYAATNLMKLAVVAEKAAEAFRFATGGWLVDHPKLANPENPDLVATPFEYRGGVKEMDAINSNLEKDRKVPVTNVHINKVEIHVNSNQDPNRIAKRTKEILWEEAARPKTALNSGVPRLTNG